MGRKSSPGDGRLLVTAPADHSDGGAELSGRRRPVIYIAKPDVSSLILWRESKSSMCIKNGEQDAVRLGAGPPWNVVTW